MSTLKVDKLDPQSGTALEIGTSGDTISIPSGATLDISASTLTPPATMPASSGINLTALNATNLGSGTVPTARLGTGTASSSTFLRGDQTYDTPAGGGGKVLQFVSATFGDGYSSTNSTTTYTASYVTDQITPTLSTSKIMINIYCRYFWTGDSGTTGGDCPYAIYSSIGGATASKIYTSSSTDTAWGFYDSVSADYNWTIPLAAQHLDSPATTSAVDYTLYIKRNTAGSLQVGASNNMAQIHLWEIDFS